MTFNLSTDDLAFYNPQMKLGHPTRGLRSLDRAGFRVGAEDGFRGGPLV